MSRFPKLLLLLTLAGISLSAKAPSVDFSAGRYNNVCKDLKEDVLLYFVFIDTRTTLPWTEYDILSTIDSIHSASRWLEQEASRHDIELNIKTDYYIGDEFATIEKNLPGKSVKEIIANQKLDKGQSTLSRWADNISRTIGESLYIKEKDGIPQQKPPGTKERLIAFLRDEYKVESVAFVLLLNNYFRDDISIAVNTLHNNDVEFCIVSYKYPSEIAHTFLNLFGAVDLHESPFRKSKRRIRLGQDLYPYDIMQDPYAKDINELEIGEFTKYMIGWSDKLPENAKLLLTDKGMRF